jgi:lipoyl(octanoyl) transferase
MIQFLYLGRVGYDEALRLQEELAGLRYEGRIGNVLLLLEHPPVLTLGRNAQRANVLASDELLAARGVTLHEINRGGDVTYHGPGQLVGYPIFDLRSLRHAGGGRLGPVDFVRQMEEALIRVCAAFGVCAGRIPGLTGVWCGLGNEAALDKPGPCRDALSSATIEAHENRVPRGQVSGHDFSRADLTASFLSSERASAREEPKGRKIVAIGIHVSRGITSHGFAFNVTTDLGDFALINPCGITDRPVTSLEREIADPARLPGLEAVAYQAARQFGAVFNEEVLPLKSLEQLRAQAQATEAQKFPAEDTPLRIPPEVERLRHREHRTEKA